MPGISIAQEAAAGPETPDLGISINVEKCNDADLGELLLKLNIETSTLSPELSKWLHGTRPKVNIFCQGEVLTIEVVDPETNRVVDQKIDVNEAVSLAMARYLALIVVELLEASEEALVQSEQEPETETRPETEQAQPQELEEPSPLLHLTVAPVLWFGGSPIWLSYGGHLGLEISALGWLTPTVDLEVSYGRNEVSMGTVNILQLSGAALLLFPVPIERISFLFGFGFRLGASIWKGVPDNSSGSVGSTNTLPWHGPCADLRISFYTGRLGQLGINAQGGWYSYEAHAEVDGVKEMSLQYGWFRIGLMGKFRLL